MVLPAAHALKLVEVQVFDKGISNTVGTWVIYMLYIKHIRNFCRGHSSAEVLLGSSQRKEFY